MKTKAVILVHCFSIATFNINEAGTYHIIRNLGKFRCISLFGISAAYAYPPAVGILSNSKNCMSCHTNNGPWKDENKFIIDILDKETKKSFKQPDGSFLIEAKRWEQKTVLTVIGKKKDKSVAEPYRNAWLYIDPATIGTQFSFKICTRLGCKSPYVLSFSWR